MPSRSKRSLWIFLARATRAATAELLSARSGLIRSLADSRKNVSALELFFAKLAADDEDAETIRQVCERAGVRIPKNPSAGFRPGDSIAVSASFLSKPPACVEQRCAGFYSIIVPTPGIWSQPRQEVLIQN